MKDLFRERGLWGSERKLYSKWELGLSFFSSKNLQLFNSFIDFTEGTNRMRKKLRPMTMALDHYKSKNQRLQESILVIFQLFSPFSYKI